MHFSHNTTAAASQIYFQVATSSPVRPSPLPLLAPFSPPSRSSSSSFLFTIIFTSPSPSSPSSFPHPSSPYVYGELFSAAWQRPLPRGKKNKGQKKKEKKGRREPWQSAGARAPRQEPKLVSASQHVELACLGHSQMVLQLPLCPPSLSKQRTETN